jgi:hypothetical protein
METITSRQLNQMANKNTERIIYSEIISIRDAVYSAAQKGSGGIHIKLSPKVVLYKTELLDKLKTVFSDCEIRILLPENILSIIWYTQ